MPDLLSAVLIDLDGTLVDSLPILRRVYRAFLQEHGRDGSDKEFDLWNGPPLREIVAGLATTHGLSQSLPALVAAYQRLIDAAYPDAPLMPGAIELVEWLSSQSLSLALVTSAGTALATRILEKHGLATRFQAVVGGDAVGAGKPAPDLYLQALRLLNVSAPMALAVEDSPAGVRAARGAQVRCVGVAKEPPGRQSLLFAGAIVGARDLWEVRDVCAGLLHGVGREVPAAAVRGKASPIMRSFSQEQEADVARVWASEILRRPGLVDGEIVGLRGWKFRGATLEVACERVRYRHFLAQRHGLSLGLCAVVGSAVTTVLAEDGGVRVVLGQRADDVTQYPLHWELVPSGGVSVEHVTQPGEVDFSAQIAEELEEETGIGRDAILNVRYLGLVEDVNEHVVDVALELEIRVTAARFLEEAARAEYTELALVPIDGVASFIESRGLAVPSVAALLRLRASKPAGVSPLGR